MKTKENQTVKVTLKGYHAIAYKYLLKCKFYPFEILKNHGRFAVYEKYRELKFKERRINEYGNVPEWLYK